MGVRGAGERIQSTLLSWAGVSAQPHRFGGREYRIGRREIGHVHGDWLVDVPLPKKVRDEAVAAGRAEPHHVLPESGWVSVHLSQEADIEGAIALLRLSYDAAQRQRARSREAPG
ncbi:MAG TPA: luciferase family protein [Anaerolineales bacterium]|nr:luciferase family protein [Anaerolineales bacterium]